MLSIQERGRRDRIRDDPAGSSRHEVGPWRAAQPGHGHLHRPRKVRPTKRHGKDTWGLTYEKAGFHYAGKTKGGLLAFQLLPEDMPLAESALPPI